MPRDALSGVSRRGEPSTAQWATRLKTYREVRTVDSALKNVWCVTQYTVVVAALAVVGCGDVGGGPSTGGNSGAGANVTVGGVNTTYKSVGETAGLSVGTKGGVFVLESFDPGVFVQAWTADDEGGINPAQFDGTGGPDGSDGFEDDGAGDDDSVKPPDDGGDGDWTGDDSDGAGDDAGPSDSFADFPVDFEFSDAFNNFVESLMDGSLDFIDFPFDEFLGDHGLTDVFPGLPSAPDDFGDYKLGELPETADGYPEFPDIPGTSNEFASWFDDESGPVPDSVPATFYDYQDAHDALAAYIEKQGTTGSANYYDVMNLLPDGFLSPEQVADWLEDFGNDTPMIGRGSTVNADLEMAFGDCPPVPYGFAGFAFQGEFDQFDDLFTRYDQAAVGEGKTLQVNSTFTVDLGAGIMVTGSQTTVIEGVLSEATPLVEMSQDVYQTQWVVNIRQATNVDYSAFYSAAPDSTEEGRVFVETISQMVWTVVAQEMDTDTDGQTDQVRVVGTGTLAVLESTIEGPEVVEMIGDAFLGPAVVPPFSFDAVLVVDAD